MSTDRILKLPEIIANQIAAGEVIERPAAVVKELIENSLDAKANDITLLIERGGSQLISVKDNGKGILKDDLPLAIVQHATSKIETSQDLLNISSLGFRGEALASIMAVSKLKISSKPALQDIGWELVGVNSKSFNINPSKISNGSLIEVKDLFYNVPARKKFLRSSRTEYLHIEECFKRLALSNMSSKFTFIADNNVVKTLPKCNGEEDKLRRVASLCGNKFIKESSSLEVERNDFRLYGWLKNPEHATNSPGNQYFFLNGRIIKDRVINHAIKSAYLPFIPAGCYLDYVLFFDLSPDLVDVNVHPTKYEVRFRENRIVHDFIQQAVEQVLSKIGSNIQSGNHNDIHTHKENNHISTYNKSTNLQEEMSNKSVSNNYTDKENKYANHTYEHYNNAKIPKNYTDIFTNFVGDKVNDKFKPLAVIDAKYLLAQELYSIVFIDLYSAFTSHYLQILNNYNTKQKFFAFEISYHMANKLYKVQKLLAELHIEFDILSDTSLIVRKLPFEISDKNLINLLDFAISCKEHDKLKLACAKAGTKSHNMNLNIISSKINSINYEKFKVTLNSSDIAKLFSNNILKVE